MAAPPLDPPLSSPLVGSAAATPTDLSRCPRQAPQDAGETPCCHVTWDRIRLMAGGGDAGSDPTCLRGAGSHPSGSDPSGLTPRASATANKCWRLRDS